MRKFAQVLYGCAHWVFQAEAAPEFAPGVMIVDVTDVTPTPQEGWAYDAASGAFSAPPGPTLAEVKSAKWKAIKAERNRRTEQGGYKVAVNGVDRWFHGDQKSRAQQLGLALLGANIPSNLQWKTMDGGFVAMTPPLVGEMLAAAVASDQAIFAAAEAHKAALNASADPATYDFSNGWPPVYGQAPAGAGRRRRPRRRGARGGARPRQS